MHNVFLGIGGNLGNKKENLKRCISLIEEHIGEVKKKSSVYETPPWGFESKDNFWNQVLLVGTLLSPVEVLDKINLIDKSFARKRQVEGYSSRKMDVDILLYDSLAMESANLVIPHPQMHKRNFVIVPLVEIAPLMIHPVFQKSIKELLEICPDTSQIKDVKNL